MIVATLTHLTGDVRDKDVCDIGCGQGAITRRLARAGARVVGVDISERLLEMAKQYEDAEPLKIAYLKDDARSLTRLSDGSFDLVICHFALIDIDDLDAYLNTVARVLRSSGTFVFVMTHSCFLGPQSRRLDEDWVVGNYLKEGIWRSDFPEGVRGKVRTFHRTLSTYINSLVAADLMTEKLIEPHRPAGGNPRLPQPQEVPAFPGGRCKKV